MKDKITNLIPYFLFTIIMFLMVIFTKISNLYLITIVYISISIYLIFNNSKIEKTNYKRYLYLLWILLTILIDIFFFSIFNIIVSSLALVIIFTQFLFKKKKINIEVVNEKKEKEPIINVDLPSDFNIKEFETTTKKLYIDMQTYFMNLDYDNLKRILSDSLYEQFKLQMNHLEKNNKRAIRDNIEIIDFIINEYNTLTLKVSIGVHEDKYTKDLNSKSETRVISYENYYELTIEKKESWIIQDLKLLYSHSKRN